MNMIVLWLVLMISAWVLAAYVLWGTDIVVSREHDEEPEGAAGERE
jgi:hypothetical protein